MSKRVIYEKNAIRPRRKVRHLVKCKLAVLGCADRLTSRISNHFSQWQKISAEPPIPWNAEAGEHMQEIQQAVQIGLSLHIGFRGKIAKIIKLH